MTGINKRAFKRVKRKFQIKYFSKKDARSGAATSENVSVGGMYFITLDNLRIGCVLECNIIIPGALCEARWLARVVRCENIPGHLTATYGVAVEFIRSYGDSEKDLKRVIEHD